jgi:hypothetical protein
MQTESLQQASSVINHSILFSEKMAMNLQSGVPYTLDLITGHIPRLTIEFESASTIKSVSSKVCH